jgi:hypothetical protein
VEEEGAERKREENGGNLLPIPKSRFWLRLIMEAAGLKSDCLANQADETAVVDD